MNLHVRDVPDDVHRVLASRAAAQGTSLRAYVVELLAAHASLPTLDEWLDEVAAAPPLRPTSMSGAAAVRMSRKEREDQLDGARPGS